MVFLRYQDRFLSSEGKLVKEKQFFFTTNASDGVSVYLHTLVPSPRMYVGYKCMTVDPFAAAPLRVVPQGNGYIFQYTNTQEYWKVTVDFALELTPHVAEAASFYAENWVEEGVDIDTHLHNIHNHGYTIIPNLITSHVVDQLVSKLQLPEMLEAGEIQKRYGELLEKDEAFGAALTHPLLVTIIRMYLHPKAKCATWSSNTLYPRQAPIQETYDWHVDYPYHDMQAPWQAEPLSTQVLWCLDDFKPENGGTLIIPGSHQARTFPTPQGVANKHVEVLTASKGSVVISHGGWWHSQGINRTQERRSCLLGTFVQPWIQPKDDMSKQYHALPDTHPHKAALKDVLGM